MNISKQRQKSSIGGLRYFHNWIKRTLINDTATYLRQTYGITEIKLLDIAVGKGGDMNKWYDSGIYDVVGIDIDNDSINGKNGAKERYEQLKHQTKIPLNYSFYVFDLSDPNNIPKIDSIIKSTKFNIVSCQFAIHYFFKDANSLDTFMNIATRYMADNAFFIGTTMNGNILNQLFSKQGPKIISDLYSLEKLPNSENDKYGNKYKVNLGNKQKEKDNHYFSQKASIEYMVDLNELINVASKYGLIFSGQESFAEWIKYYKKASTVTKSEREFSFLNFSFAFKKTQS